MADQEVLFSVKELFQAIQLKLEHIDAKLDTKADKSDLDRLRERLTLLEKLFAGWDGADKGKRWIIGLVVAICLQGLGTGLLFYFLSHAH